MKINFLCLLLILLLILINKKKISIEKFSTNDQIWIDYRLEDIFYDYRKLYIKKKNNLSYMDNISSKYPNSIGDKYRVETKNFENKGGNYEILKKIIDNEKYEKPKENDIILHLRIGDVILGYKNNKFIFRKSSNGTQYCIPLKVVDNLLKKLDNNKKIILVYGSHKKGKDKLSQKYINEVEKIIKKYNFNFEHKNSCNPDQDFVFMCNSKTFIKSNGNYSKIISEIVKMNGNKVIDTNNIDKEIIFFTQFYIPKDLERKKEVVTCLKNNISNPLINKIYLFGEEDYNFKEILGNINIQKIKYINIGDRLSYKKTFETADKLNSGNQIFILANSDIYFDETLKKLFNFNLKKHFLALTRIEEVNNGKNIYYEKDYISQDTWIWQDKLNIENRNISKFKHYNKDGIKLGIHGCDNYIAYMMEDVGFIVKNKCKLINTFHLHKNQFREWQGKNKLNYNLEFKKKLKCE
jgi:hypothetical protein